MAVLDLSRGQVGNVNEIARKQGHTIQCWIFDIDGTLANGDHRKHHIVREDGQPKDWDAYFATLDRDTPYEHMRRLTHLIQAHGVAVVYVTGRPAEYYDRTNAWLRTHCFPVGPLYCRPAGDRRDDDIVKIELLAKLRADGYEPIMAFDDRTRVVKAWRAAGVPCAQVAEGDF